MLIGNGWSNRDERVHRAASFAVLQLRVTSGDLSWMPDLSGVDVSTDVLGPAPHVGATWHILEETVPVEYRRTLDAAGRTARHSLPMLRKLNQFRLVRAGLAPESTVGVVHDGTATLFPEPSAVPLPVSSQPRVVPRGAGVSGTSEKPASGDVESVAAAPAASPPVVESVAAAPAASPPVVESVAAAPVAPSPGVSSAFTRETPLKAPEAPDARPSETLGTPRAPAFVTEPWHDSSYDSSASRVLPGMPPVASFSRLAIIEEPEPLCGPTAATYPSTTPQATPPMSWLSSPLQQRPQPVQPLVPSQQLSLQPQPPTEAPPAQPPTCLLYTSPSPRDRG